MSEKSLIFGIDVGFGDVKVVGKGVQFKFPTAVCYANNGVEEDDEFFKRQKVYEFEGQKYLLGEEALINSFATRSLDFLIRYAPLFVFKAFEIAKVDKGKVGVGLPLAFYKKDTKETFLKRFNNAVINGSKLDVNVKVYPQGVGCYFDYVVNEKGDVVDDRANQTGFVLDIGFNTVDIVYFDKGQPIRNHSGMFERFGISRVTTKLGDYIRSELGINLTEQETKDVFLKGYIKIYGDKRDLSEVIRRYTEEYAYELIGIIRSKWENLLKRSDVFVIAGGGAYYLKGRMPSEYGKMVYFPDNPEFSNARGFYKLTILNGKK